jgi:hypothetical protein
MKGIYLSEEGKKAIEDKIAELEVARREHEKVEINMFDSIWAAKTSQAIDMLKEILSSATILPVEEDWDDTIPDGTPWEDSSYTLSKKHPNGVIIQPK